MEISNLRDAVILSYLGSGSKSMEEIEDSLGLQKAVAKKSMVFLKKSGLVSRKKIEDAEFFVITDNGIKTIEAVKGRIWQH